MKMKKHEKSVENMAKKGYYAQQKWRNDVLSWCIERWTIL